jgi:hypothetical protein
MAHRDNPTLARLERDLAERLRQQGEDCYAAAAVIDRLQYENEVLRREVRQLRHERRAESR